MYDDTPSSLSTRMQSDLHKALQQKQHKKDVRWAMVIDQKLCLGCHACTVACITENALPPQVMYRPVLEEESGVYPHVSRVFLPRPCMHCAKPSCVPACPVKATWQEESSGLIRMDRALCVGCGRCIKACPYGARQMDRGQSYSAHAPSCTHVLLGREGMEQGYGAQTLPERGESASQKEYAGTRKGKAYKCHFCLPRLERGLLPACVTSCIGRATFFGNLADVQSLVYALAHSPRATQLLQTAGTKPHVFYLK